mgnify:CR=1 FL=1|tara:strand:+ start:2186 stop:2437 length:252 start_codon:yes stop_codon:yes gene_type:complete
MNFYSGKVKKTDKIALLFAKGPRNQDEIDILTEHIQKESKLISDSWSDKEREVRAKRAGSPRREEYCLAPVSSSLPQLINDDG